MRRLLRRLDRLWPLSLLRYRQLYRLKRRRKLIQMERMLRQFGMPLITCFVHSLTETRYPRRKTHDPLD